MDACIRRSWYVPRPRRNPHRIERRVFAYGLLLLAVIPLLAADDARSADLRTRNFIVMAPTPELARSVGDAAEAYRRDLAVYWLGGELPAWPNPCPIRVVAGSNLAAQGVTTYNRSPVRDFQMEVIGSPQRILDSVLPHEVTHTILATYFGRPLPRWADEGICTTVEHDSERQKHETKLREFLRSRRGIAMNKLFLMTEYPSDVLPLYAQGYSVCQFLIAQQGPREFVSFLGDYMQKPSWTDHVRSRYGYDSLAELQEAWLAWVADGSGPVDAYVKNPAASPAANTVAAAPTGPANPAILGDPNSLMGSVGQFAAAGSVATAGGLVTPERQAADPTAAVALASASGSAGQEGWYSRLRQEVARGGGGAEGRRSMGPGSFGQSSSLHSVAQPQPEQGSVPGGISPGGAGAQAAPFQVQGQASDYRPGSLSSSGSYWR